MKRYIIALTILLTTATGSVFADSINFAGGYQTNGNNTTSDAYAIKYIHDVNKQLDVDILLQGSKNNDTNATTDQYEIGARYKVPVADKSAVYLRGMLGSLQPSGVNNRNYVAAEIGAMTKFDNGYGLRVDHAFMTGTNVDNMDNGFTRAWVSYDISKENTVAIRRDWMRGDLEFDTWRVLFQHRF